jgi:hypothetical protein
MGESDPWLEQVVLLVKQLVMMTLHFAGRSVSPKSYQLEHENVRKVLQTKECLPVKPPLAQMIKCSAQK